MIPVPKCQSCGVPYETGALLDPGIWDRVRDRGFRRCLGFPYEWFIADERALRRHKPQGEVTAENCDSVYVDSMLVSPAICPKCSKPLWTPPSRAVAHEPHAATDRPRVGRSGKLKAGRRGAGR